MVNNLFIGGSGLLGINIKSYLDIKTPTSKELDITDYSSVRDYLSLIKIDTLILSAAYTNSGASNKEISLVNKVNIEGPRNIIKALTGTSTRLVYISSDYVFKGDTGMYKPLDTTYPVQNNYYAYSKAVAEEIVKTYKHFLIIRTSFCNSTNWPYKVAFVDKYTSADKVSIVAPLIAKGINKYENGIIHIGTERKSVYSLAKQINDEVQPGSRLSFPDIGIPYDTSLELTEL